MIHLLRLITFVVVAWTSSVFAATETLKGPAPQFALPAKAGGQVQLADFQGDVVMVNFWASWCAPCRQEMPLIEGLYK
ncbi:MAG TPA: TlpA disulfide reductase family protein, partial [Dongiaceae bacterium]|nr:TlpA disulfide reductase family protein [Dongiaceae bacterium]